MNLQIRDEALLQSEIVTALVVSRVNAEMQVEQLQAALKSEKDEHHETLKKFAEQVEKIEAQKTELSTLCEQVNKQAREIISLKETDNEEAFFDRVPVDEFSGDRSDTSGSQPGVGSVSV